MNARRRPLLNNPEAANYLNCSPKTLFRLREERKIPWMKVRGRIMFDSADLEAYLARQRTEAVDEWDF